MNCCSVGCVTLTFVTLVDIVAGVTVDLSEAMSIYCDKIHVTLLSTIDLLSPSLILKDNKNRQSLGMIHGDL